MDIWSCRNATSEELQFLAHVRLVRCVYVNLFMIFASQNWMEMSRCDGQKICDQSMNCGLLGLVLMTLFP